MITGPRDVAQIRLDNALLLFDEFVHATIKHPDAATLRGHVETVLAEGLLAPGALAALATVDTKAEDPQVRALADALGVPVRAWPAAVLDAQEVPTPSDVVAEAVGTRSVAEAAVLACGARLVVPKHVAGSSTVAVGRLVEEPS